jgi:hypothetical protein
MANKSYGQLINRIQQLEQSVGQISALLNQLQTGAASGGTPANRSRSSGSGSGGGGGGSGGGGSFTDYAWPSDAVGLGFGIGGRIANAIYKTKAAKQLARGNSAQHFASALSTPQSQAIFGSPLSDMAKVSAEAGQANAAKSLATGEAWQGSLEDVSNFINSINTMRRLMKGDALSAMSLHAMRMFGQGMGSRRGGGLR